MGGLGHFLERAGFATTQISLIREHTLQIKPPRAVLTPFELGRPFGAPNEPEFQKRVLLMALKLLEAESGPIIAEWTEKAPGPAVDMEGWSCPIDLGPGMDALDVNESPHAAVMQEIDKLRPWYDTSKKNLGRTIFGVSNLDLTDIVQYLVDFVEDSEAPWPNPELLRSHCLKLCIDDLRAYYYEASIAQPGNVTDKELADWYYGETVISDLLLKVNSVCAATDDEILLKMSSRGIIPTHQEHRKH